jgi:hypothetical protein
VKPLTMFSGPVLGANELSPPVPVRARKPRHKETRPPGESVGKIRKVLVFLLGAMLLVYAYHHQSQLQSWVNGRLDWVGTKFNEVATAAALRQQTTERENEVNQASQ